MDTKVHGDSQVSIPFQKLKMFQISSRSGNIHGKRKSQYFGSETSSELYVSFHRCPMFGWVSPVFSFVSDFQHLHFSDYQYHYSRSPSHFLHTFATHSLSSICLFGHGRKCTFIGKICKCANSQTMTKVRIKPSPWLWDSNTKCCTSLPSKTGKFTFVPGHINVLRLHPTVEQIKSQSQITCIIMDTCLKPDFNAQHKIEYEHQQ